MDFRVLGWVRGYSPFPQKGHNRLARAVFGWLQIEKPVGM
jgi:hypothetical protein